MILVDTSVWIDYFRGASTRQADYLQQAIQRDDDLCTCGIIVTEILQGIPSDEELREVKNDLASLIFLPMPDQSYYLAANIYRKAKSKGLMIRSTIDCLIGACAIENGAILLQNDKDYQAIARVSSLRLIVIGQFE